jgi:hypothetical protein
VGFDDGRLDSVGGPGRCKGAGLECQPERERKGRARLFLFFIREVLTAHPPVDQGTPVSYSRLELAYLVVLAPDISTIKFRLFLQSKSFISTIESPLTSYPESQLSC